MRRKNFNGGKAEVLVARNRRGKEREKERKEKIRRGRREGRERLREKEKEGEFLGDIGKIYIPPKTGTINF